MTLFGAPDTSAQRPLPKWLAPSAGLLVAAAIACLGCRLPRLGTLSWPDVIRSAAGRVILVFVASSATIWSFRFIRRNTKTAEGEQPVLSIALYAVWLVPIIALLCAGSVWAVAITALAVASTTTMFRSPLGKSDVIGIERPALLPLFADAYCLSDPSPTRRQFLTAVIMALLGEGAVAACLAGLPLIAVPLAAISSALWASCFRTEEARSLKSDHSRLRGATIVVLAIMVTAASLMPYLKYAPGSGGLGLFFASTRRRRPSPLKEQEQAWTGEAVESSAPGSDDAYSGILLWSKKQELMPLVAPTPVFGNYQTGMSGGADPLIVPFNGVYWFFKAPNVRPPRGSHEAHGSPELVTTRSTDRVPLSMEAHQNLGALIDLNCCSRIQVVIRNTDRYPDTVYLELVLTDTSLSKRPSQSLGNVRVRSTRPWKLYGDRPVVQETVTFPIPARATINRFDEVSVVFHLDPMRADFGAKIGIEKFVLVPRGL